jgi:hypothetical protein
VFRHLIISLAVDAFLDVGGWNARGLRLAERSSISAQR